MTHLIRTTAAAACAVALAAVPAGAETITRDTTQRVTVEKTCEWEVDAKGNPIIDADGNPIPVTDKDGKQVCKERKVSTGSSKWADDTTDELRIGAIVGVVGALLALVLGGGLLFIESVDITMLPPAR